MTGPLLTAPSCGFADPLDCDPGDALVEGILLHEGDCLFVDAGNVRLALLWSFGTMWQEEPEAVVSQGGDQYLVGHEILIGGGGQNVENLAYFFPDSDPPSELNECASTPGVEGFWHAG